MTLRASAQPAWILHRREYRDSSLILDLLTMEYGRISVVARGARKSKSGACLQPFRLLKLDFFLKGDLGTLGRYEPHGRAVELNGLRLWCGFYCNELLLRLVAQAEQNDSGPFDLYQQLMEVLPHDSPARVLRYFEYRLLELMGFSFDPEVIQARQHYAWDPLHGLCVQAHGVRGQVLLDLTLPGWQAKVEGGQVILAQMLQQQLAGKPLKTAAMLRDLVALRQLNAATTHAKQ